MTEIPWKTVCCPVDLSEASRAALRVASDVCRRLGASLTLLHVHDGQPAGEQLTRWRADAQAAGVQQVSAEETTGDPQTAIAAWADAHGVDLVVMGTHGRTGRAHALVGSVAESTVRQAHCPVMVVHDEWMGTVH